MKYRIAYHDSQTGMQTFIRSGEAMPEPEARELLDQLKQSAENDTRFTFWLVKAEREEPR